MSNLVDRVHSAQQEALKARDELRLSVFRMLSAAIHNREIEKRTRAGTGGDAALDDAEAAAIIRSELKKRKDAVEAYRSGGRQEQARREEREADVLSGLLPQELSDDELGLIAHEGKEALGVSSAHEFGTLMGWVMGRVKGRASGERVRAIIERELGGS